MFSWDHIFVIVQNRAVDTSFGIVEDVNKRFLGGYFSVSKHNSSDIWPVPADKSITILGVHGVVGQFAAFSQSFNRIFGTSHEPACRGEFTERKILFVTSAGAGLRNRRLSTAGDKLFQTCSCGLNFFHLFLLQSFKLARDCGVLVLNNDGLIFPGRTIFPPLGVGVLCISKQGFELYPKGLLTIAHCDNADKIVCISDNVLPGTSGIYNAGGYFFEFENAQFVSDFCSNFGGVDLDFISGFYGFSSVSEAARVFPMASQADLIKFIEIRLSAGSILLDGEARMWHVGSFDEYLNLFAKKCYPPEVERLIYSCRWGLGGLVLKDERRS